MSYSAVRPSRISRLRTGILSMVRDSSRTSHGNGLRSLMPPSLPINASINPRGRSFLRSAELAEGAVSTITTTSRSARSSARAASSSICSMKRGSFGLSAKTTIGRASHLKSSRVTASVDSITARSARHSSTDDSAGDKGVSATRAGPQLINAPSAKAKTRFIHNDIITNFPLHSPRRLR